MKKILLTLILFAAVGLTAKLQAQQAPCTLNVSNATVKINSVTSNGTSCIVNVDFTFDLSGNNGNKYTWMHMWDGNYPNLSYSAPPTAADLVNSLANIGIKDTLSTFVYQTSYPPAPSVTVQIPSSLSHSTNPDGSDHFTFGGITLTLPNTSCNSAITIKADVWSTNSASQNAVHCFFKGVTFVANDPTVHGLLICTNPRHYNVNISTISATTLSGTYNVYIDNGDGIFDPNTDSLVKTNIAWSAVTGTPYNSGSQTYNGNSTLPYANRALWIQVTTTGYANKTNDFAQNTCAPLPVNFASFTAKREQTNVKLVWQTATEINNSGFAIERNINGTWEQVGFVPSQAPAGNSSDLLTYTYIDANSAKGITQYRIRQIDFDNKSAYSQILAVRGTDSPAKTIIYPNPSFDGRVNVVFDDANNGLRDVSLMDMSGRIVKQWNGISNNNLTIDNLTPGFYSLRVVVRETGMQSVEKIVINKR